MTIVDAYMIIYCELDKDAEFPEYATEGAAGADLRARLDEPVELLPGQRILISTGLKILIPEGYEIQIRSRSGLSFKHGIVVLNSPGTIDSDYRGEIKVLLANFGENVFIIEPKMRIAQAILAPVVQMKFVTCPKEEKIESTLRGVGGFGHTGVN